jgi:hypothetical protein
VSYSGLIIALDVSKRCTGIAEARPGEVPRFAHVAFGKADDDFFDADARAVGWIADRLYLEPDLTQVRLVIEAPLQRDSTGGSNVGTILQAYALCKVIGGFARRRGVMAITGNVTTVRKAFLGRGNLGGEEAKRRAKATCEALGWAPPNLDCADAGALLWWACEKWAPGVMPAVDPLFTGARAA